MSAPTRQGRRRSTERHRLAGALVASCSLHLLAIVLWFSLLAGLFAGVALPTPPLRDRFSGPTARDAEMVVTTIEFRRKRSPAPRHVAAPHPLRPAPVPVAAAPRPSVTSAPRRPRPLVEPAAPTPNPQATAQPAAEPSVVPPALAPSPEPAAARVATQPSAAAPTPTPAARVAQAGLWGLDSAPVLLDRIGALLGDVHRRLRIEITVDADGRATAVRIEEGAGDAALEAHVSNALLSAHYAAARCNNLPCPGELQLTYAP
ncbi:MAG: hypothetical protein KGM44_05640 [bacterium]|nr:hypothetical protein [bacterium]